MHVGVFLSTQLKLVGISSLPHARGGVSDYMELGNHCELSSPCTWGCFLIIDVVAFSINVFPMHVGVFP